MRLFKRFGGLVLVVAVVSVGLLDDHVFAQAGLSACVNPAGQMRIIENSSSCTSQERLITWAIEGPAGPAGPPGPSGSSGPMVVDANGARLGWFSGGLVLMRLNDYWFTVFVTRDGFSTPSLGTSFTYLSGDCTGQRYTVSAVNSSPLVPNALVLSQQAWFADNEAPKVFVNGTPQEPVTVSTQQVGPSGPTSPCLSNSIFFNAVLTPMRSVDVSNFVTPFRLTN